MACSSCGQIVGHHKYCALPKTDDIDALTARLEAQSSKAFSPWELCLEARTALRSLRAELKELRKLALHFRIAHGGYPACEARWASVKEFLDNDSY